jgi:RNA:NAD 2'-phosphotransferase (TPT1/KptA family)
MDWKRKLREEGYIELEGLRIELSLDNTFMDIDYIPRVLVYSEETGRWHVLRNPIPKGRTLEEGWDNAVKVLEEIAEGRIKPELGEPGVERCLVSVLRKLGEFL